MKIVVATPLYPPEPGGPATYSKLLEEGFPKEGIEVVLVKFSDVRRSAFRHVAYFRHVYRAARNADLVYALDPVSVGLPAFCAAKLARRPFVVKIVGDFAWEQGRQRFGITETLDEFVRHHTRNPVLAVYRFVQSLVARGAERIIVPSHYLEQIVAEWGVRRNTIDVVWNAVAMEAPAAVPASVANLKKPLVVSVGRLVPWKGFFELIHALQLVRESGIAASLAIIGDGPDRDVLKEQAEKRLNGDYVLTGALSHGETLAAIAHADIFVLDSLYEGLSHTLIEALTLGKTVVVSNVGGNVEIVRHEENGLVVQPESADALGVALVRLLKNPALATRLASVAKQSSGDFAVNNMLEKTAAILTSIKK